MTSALSFLLVNPKILDKIFRKKSMTPPPTSVLFYLIFFKDSREPLHLALARHTAKHGPTQTPRVDTPVGIDVEPSYVSAYVVVVNGLMVLR